MQSMAQNYEEFAAEFPGLHFCLFAERPTHLLFL
jgi:hypothetical protein